MIYLKLVIFALITTFSTSAFAWTWTCSPKDSNVVAKIPPPKINLMVDKSGSMGPNGGTFASTCKVCEIAGNKFVVDSYAECGGGGWSTTPQTIILGRYSVSQYPRYDFNMPVPATAGDLVGVTIDIQGDYGSSTERANVYIGGNYVGRINGGGSDCSSQFRQTFVVDRSTLPAGNNIAVSVIGTYSVSTHCSSGRNNTTVTLEGPNYLGSQTNDNVCGVTKWDIAKNALDSLTTYSDSVTPELAHFGMGLFSYSSANNLVSCGSKNHDAIMNQLNANSPNGGTPTGTAIRTSIASACFANAATEPTASILVNDGAPSGGDTGRLDAINAACDHRSTALLYIVGLGSGTDEDYNNILAAAGGTGTCDNDVDPCDDTLSWASLRNKCQGSIQTSNQNELTTAIGSISADLGCSFKINFGGTILASVPADGTSRYEYLYVDYTDAAGIPLQIYHEDSSLAVDIDGDGVKDGWNFVDVNRDFVKFSPSICGQIQKGEIVETATQLACLCEEPVGDTCNVPNYAANGVCPTGVWQCTEGVDWCEPVTDCCVGGDSCTAPGAVGICAQGETVCPADSGIDGALPSGDISFQISSADPDDETTPHILDTITVSGVVYSDLLVPDSYESSFPNGTTMYTTRNDSVEDLYADNPATWDAKALPAFQSRNLGFYHANDSLLSDGVDHYTLSYNEPVIVTQGRFIAFTERHLNNPVNIQAFDSSGNALGALLNVLTSDYVGSNHRSSLSQEIGIATFPLDDLAPVEAEISSIKVFPLSYGAADAADGKVFIFGDIPTNADGSGASQICVPAVQPETEVCDGLDNDCDGNVDEIDDTTCTVSGQTGRCAEGQLSCTNSGGVFALVCNQDKFPMPELCDGLDNDCNGQEDDISKSWKKTEFQIHKQSITNPLDEAKACDFEDVCICRGGAKDDHAGSDFMTYLDEWDPACVCLAGLEEATQTPQPVIENNLGGEEENKSSDTAVTGCSSTANGSGSLPLFIFLGFFLIRRRRR